MIQKNEDFALEIIMKRGYTASKSFSVGELS